MRSSESMVGFTLARLRAFDRSVAVPEPVTEITRTSRPASASDTFERGLCSKQLGRSVRWE